MSGQDGGAVPPGSTIFNMSELDDYIDNVAESAHKHIPEHIRKQMTDGETQELLQDLRWAVERVISDHFSPTPA